MNSQNSAQKRFFIHTLGCKVNQYETQAMREILTAAGFSECISKEMADVYIINTCTVTDKTDRESRHWISLFHKTNPNAKIVVTGCYAEHNTDDINFLPGISHIVKNKDKSGIADIINGLVRAKAGPRINIPDAPMFITDFKNHTRAFIKIQDGCDNHCSYCKVPLVRSSLSSKPINLIVDETRGLVSKGFKEVVLTGICLGAWGKDLFPQEVARDVGISGAGLVDVLKELCKIRADFRIRLSSIEPKYVTDELISFIADNNKICRHLHIPLQSGDDDILRKMNRPYTTAVYKALVDKVRSKIKDAAITTDIMVAFPGESDVNFRNSLNFVKDILPARSHIFTFSKRTGTAAYGMPYDISQETARKRYYELRAAAISAAYIYREKFLGQALEVLVETKRDKNTGLLTGYSDNYIKILFEGKDELMGRIVQVRIDDLNLIYTKGVYEDSLCASRF